MLFEDILGIDLAIPVNITLVVLISYLIIVTVVSEVFSKVKIGSSEETKKKKRKFWSITKFTPLSKGINAELGQRNNNIKYKEYNNIPQ